MKNLFEPEGVTEKELQTYIAGLQENAEKDVRTLLDSGAGEAEVAEYIVSLEREPDDEIGPPEGQPPPRMEKKSQPSPRMEKKSQPSPRMGKKSQPSPRMEKKSQPSPRMARKSQPSPRMARNSQPPGVQGANTGYWQAGGVTRAGAKRSKRP